MAKPIPTFERCHELLKLDPETGILTWRVQKSATSLAGSRAGWLHTQSGYRNVCIDWHDYREHLVIWLMLYGEWAPRKIDHRDLDRANNSPSNLRRANESQQHANTKNRSDNTTGERGVSKHQDGGYVARVYYQGIKLNKYFQTFQEAAAAAKAARLRLFGEFAPSHDQQGA